MLGFGFVEWIVIFLLLLFLFGPKELPKGARLMARLIYEMKNIFRKLETEWNLDPEKEQKSSSSVQGSSVQGKNEND